MTMTPFLKTGDKAPDHALPHILLSEVHKKTQHFYVTEGKLRLQCFTTPFPGISGAPSMYFVLPPFPIGPLSMSPLFSRGCSCWFPGHGSALNLLLTLPKEVLTPAHSLCLPPRRTAGRIPTSAHPVPLMPAQVISFLPLGFWAALHVPGGNR